MLCPINPVHFEYDVHSFLLIECPVGLEQPAHFLITITKYPADLKYPIHFLLPSLNTCPPWNTLYISWLPSLNCLHILKTLYISLITFVEYPIHLEYFIHVQIYWLPSFTEHRTETKRPDSQANQASRAAFSNRRRNPLHTWHWNALGFEQIGENTRELSLWFSIAITLVVGFV